MILDWFKSRDAAEIGVTLADHFASATGPALAAPSKKTPPGGTVDTLRDLLEKADRDVRPLRLNFYKKAKLANSFKWRLIENGVNRDVADEVTQQLVMRLSGNEIIVPGFDQSSNDRHPNKPRPMSAKALFAEGNKRVTVGAYDEAIEFYRDLLRVDPRHVAGLGNLGAALFHLGKYQEAEDLFNKAIRLDPNFPDGYSNLGNALMLKGRFEEAEGILRRALKLNPRHLDARINLGLTLAFLGRVGDARRQLEKALKIAPGNANANYGMALVARTEGAFVASKALVDRALEAEPNMTRALAAVPGLSKMTRADSAWLERAEMVAESTVDPMGEADLRFAIGKYYDDVEEYKRAFENFRRANELLKSFVAPYDRESTRNFVDMMMRIYSREVVSKMDGSTDSASARPIFVVGMPRSGTSLTEQIIASHPSAAGAGELMFWSKAVHDHAVAVEKGPLAHSTRNKLAEAYLRVLQNASTDALRVVDKAPLNANYLGVIYSVFPKARIIYMQRDAIDTCLSCYFQKFVLSLNFTTDLSDLSDYYRQHARLVAHWRSVLPAGTILDVPYEGLVADQEIWTRKILDFIGLEWDERCLNFHATRREVITASYWQVRQKIYTSSVHRWRHYRKLIGPLLGLSDLTKNVTD